MGPREEIIWAAGLFEGEGSFYSWNRPAPRQPQPRASLTTTDRDVMERFMKAVGFGTYLVRQPTYRMTKPAYFWQVAAFERVQALGAAFWPWLGQRRREQWKKCLTKA